MRGEEDNVGQWMPVYIADLFNDTDDLSPAEFATYLRLLLQMWARGGVLPTDPERLARLARIDRAAFDTVWIVIGKFFHAAADGVLSQKRLAHEMARARLVRTSAQEKAKKGGKALAAKRKQIQLGLLPEAQPEAAPEASPKSAPVPLPEDPDPDSGHSAGFFPRILRLFSAIWEARYRKSYMADQRDRSNLGRLLRGSFPDKEAIEAYPWEAAFRNYLADMSDWAAGSHRHSLTNFCTSGGLNKYRVADPTAGYSQREIRSIQHAAKYDEVMASFDGGPNGRSR